MTLSELKALEGQQVQFLYRGSYRPFILRADTERQMKRFWDKAEKTETCWNWTARTRPDGYGEFRFEGRTALAHRVAYLLTFGVIPDGLHIDHLCRNRGCVRPSHLEPVTQAENTRRGRGFRTPPTHCPKGHEYTADNVYRYNGSGMKCRKCASVYKRSRSKKAQASK